MLIRCSEKGLPQALTDFPNDVDHALVHGRVRADLQEGVGLQFRLEKGD